MNLKLKTMFSLFFVLLFVFQGLVAVFAAEPETPTSVEVPVIERFSNINTCDCSCYISGFTLYASATLTAKRSMYLQIIMELQKYSDGSYSTIETWSDSKTGTSLSLDESRLINIFSTYRIKVTFTAGGESTTAYDYA